MADLTVLTATYNRGKTLNALFQSLCSQTDKSFEWWIVDDGSTDDTAQIVQIFCSQAQFPIHYIHKENGGKHTALNMAIPQITSELTMIVDSDDTLTSDAVETIIKYYSKYASYSGLCGYVFLCKSTDGYISGKLFEPSEKIGSYIEVRINGDDTHADKAEVFYTRCLQEFSFPEYPGEKFLGEDVVWLQMARKYSMVHINHVLHLFEYQNDGLTKNRRYHNITSPKGCMYRASLYMEKDIKLKYRIKGVLQYLIYGKFAGYRFPALWKMSNFKGLVSIAVLPALILYLKWKHTYLRS